MKYTFYILIFLVFISPLGAQHLYQLPKPLKKKSEINSIIGNIGNKTPSRQLNILWVYGYDKHHIAGAHDYVKVKNLMIGLLSKVPDIGTEEAFGFPTDEQFKRADLIVMYLHLPQLKKKQFTTLKKFVAKGGGLVTLHETAIMRPASKGKRLAECLGLAWNEGTSKWGAIFDRINVDNQHPVFNGFPGKITILDEFYWDLFQEEDTKILGSVRTGPTEDSNGPIPLSELSKEESPVFWTYSIDKGKVFGTTTGHHTFTYYDPEFRIILFRAMAWVIDEKPDPFMPLVFEGITKGEKVGIEEDLRGWEGKIRE
ncbi:MAG: ThuA domain-containing protein [Maribacter sp.]|nr:ThuA domain-containing protein [Maribacter sp.]